MTRRRSTPLLPHEVISNFYSSQGYPDILPSSSVSTMDSSQQQDPLTQGSNVSSQTTAFSPCGAPEQQQSKDKNVDIPVVAPGKESTSEVSPETTHVQDGGSECAHLVKTSTTPDSRTEATANQSTNLARSLSQTLPSKRHPGYFANRRSASFMIHDEAPPPQSADSNGIGPKNMNENPTGSSHSLKRTPSLVRLSLSLDGKAEVTTRTGITPSPPRSQPTPRTNAGPRPNTALQRSHSALEPGDKSAQTSIAIPFPRRRMTGRSRDSRAWEFYCDSDVRNALTEQAEREETGSATAAISLIRSCSQKKKTMTPNPNKRNAHAQKPDFPKRMKADGQKPSKPKFSRATSSIARMQTTTNDTQRQKLGNTTSQNPKAGTQTDTFQDADGDSDKENWEPGTQTRNPPRRRPAKAQSPKRVLETSLRVPSQSTSLDALMHRESSTSGCTSRKTSSSEEKENSSPDANDDIAVFMGGSAPREEEDLDCVQNLLYLSQAAWR